MKSKPIKQFTVLLGIIVLSSVLMCACGRGGFRALSTENEDKRISDVANQIVNAIKKEDPEMIKSLFSKETIEKNNNLDDEISDLFGFINGNIVSFDSLGYSSEESISYGERIMLLCYNLMISTDTHEYEMVVLDYLNEDTNADKIGIQSILVCYSGDGRLKTDPVFFGSKDENDFMVSDHPGIIIRDN